MQTYDFDRVSPTAVGPLMARGECPDIPFAEEILAYLRDRSLLPQENIPAHPHTNAALFEARFRAVSRVLGELQPTQILDLASGYSPRGLDPAFRNVTYVEVDLPKMTDRKHEIVTALRGSVPQHLRLRSGNALDPGELAQALTHFRPEPVAVTSEGLLRYLTFDEKVQLAENVRHILRLYGGWWITPDIHLRAWADDRRPNRRANANLAAQLGRDINANYFDDLPHARSFFEGCGFHIEERPLLEGIRERVLSLPRATPEVLDEIEARRIFILTARR